MRRRQFLKSGAAASSAAWVFGPHAFAKAADAHIDIVPEEVLGTISPAIYGHFTEHLGGVIYDGVWVGKGSRTPNDQGIRTKLVDKLRQIKAPLIRWPGGCFADSYDWKDGIGPPSKRPRRTNFWEIDPEARRLGTQAVQNYESNAFGTDEFVRFCRLAGAEPYLAANLRGLTPLDFDQWVEYCNSPAGTTTLADQRAANGAHDPHQVRYWGVGNESWGCGGNFTPEDYAKEFRRFTTWVPSYGTDLRFIASGPNEFDLDWTRVFFEKLLAGRPFVDPQMFGWSVHYYTWNLSRGASRDWAAGKRDALRFDATEFYEVLSQGLRMEKLITDHWTVMGEHDPQHRIKLVVDEYGPWYSPGTAIDPTHVYGQQITMRDAIHTALTLDIFNRHPDKVGAAACAQLVNCLNALFFTHEDKFTVTPNFHVFDMYSAHQSGSGVRAEFSAPQISFDRDGKSAGIPGLSGSASRIGKKITLSVVNPSADTPRETQIIMRGSSIATASITILAAADVHAHNTFEHEGVPAPTTSPLTPRANTLTCTFPAASVSTLSMTLS